MIIIYNAYYSENIETDLSIVNYLKENRINFIYRNNIFLLNYNDINTINSTKLLHNFYQQDLESIYYNLIYNPNPEFIKISNFEEILKNTNTLPIKPFILPKNTISFEDYIICEYFSTSIISKPYNLIMNLAEFISEKDKFISISANYTICKGKLILFFLYQFTRINKKECINEIEKYRNFILSKKDFINSYTYNTPYIEVCWEKLFLPDRNLNNKMNFRFIGRNEFSPINSEVLY